MQDITMEKLQNGVRKLGIKLDKKQLELFQVYYEELADWNKRINLTSVTKYEDVQVTHFLDSLTVIKALNKLVFNEDIRIIDVGTGAGFPGIPLLIAFPDVHISLLEATAKKSRFLKHIVERLGIKNAEIITGRAEDIGHQANYREAFDIVLSRAVAPLAVLVELTLPFCRTGGCAIAQKKGDITQEISEATNAINILGGEFKNTIDIDLNEFTDQRRLVVIEKNHETPSKYPRRPGIPAKRPLS